MMIEKATGIYRSITLCDKYILHLVISGYYYMSLYIPLLYGYGTY